MQRILIIALLISIQSLLFGQKVHTRCNTDHEMEAIYLENPFYKDEIEKGFQDFNRGINRATNRMDVTIPVHFIIVHLPGEEIGVGNNLTLARIQSQISVLNQDYSRTNADAANTPAQFAAGSPNIQFCIATVDPNGNPTNGITRYATTDNFKPNDIAIKQATKWPRENYLNIWVAPLEGLLLGYAFIPSTSNLPSDAIDGVVIHTPAFGGPGQATLPGYNRGRTATHEIGHFLGLIHPWVVPGCSSDDGINDTPLQDTANIACPTHPMPSCSNSGDMFMNFMDYVFDHCMNAFTIEQSAYMNTILNTSRASLANSSGLTCVGTDPLMLQVTQSTNPSCHGENDGTIRLEASGGSGIYTYTLSNGMSNSTGIFTNLIAGTYTGTVSTSTENVTIEITLVHPSELSLVTVEILNNNCFGDSNGKLSVVGSGGTTVNGNYSYQLGSNSPVSNGLFSNLAATTYTVKVTDNNGCSKDSAYVISSPNELSINFLDTTIISCSGQTGGVQIEGVGGTPDYTYSIGSGFHSSGNFTNLIGGSYTLQVKDFNECITTTTFNLDVPSPLISGVAFSNNITCNGEQDGRIEMQTSGGTMPYKYVIDNLIYTNPINGLPSGLHSIVTIDVNDCTTLDTVFIDEPSAIIGQITANSAPVCPGSANGFLQISAIGGSAPYTYRIDTQSNTSGRFTSLLPGTYSIEITDNIGCMSAIEGTIQQNPQIESSIEFTNPTCFEETNGTISILASGGTGSLLYSINNAAFVSNTTFDGLTDGDYSITMKDAIGCEVSKTVSLSDPEELIANGELIYGAFEGENKLTISVIGGTPPYQYSLDGLSNFQTENVFNHISSGFHSAFVMDSVNCVDSVNVFLTATHDLSNPGAVRIFPNPISDNFSIQIDVQENMSFDLIMFDLSGQKVLNAPNMLFSKSKNIQTFYVKDLVTSIYIVKIASGNEIMYRKVFVR